MSKHRNKIFASIVILFTVTMLVSAPFLPVKANPKFVIAIDYPSPNGNGISDISAYVDSVYTAKMYMNPDEFPTWDVNTSLEVEVGVNITLAVFCWINGTDTGISSLAEGLNIMRHNVTVICNNGTTIFSQQNFTYITGADAGAPMYFYRHDVILDFVPSYGGIYITIVTFEIYGWF